VAAVVVVFAAGVSAAVAGVVAEVGAAASVSEAEVAISATAGAGTSARIDRGSIGVIITSDPDRTTKIGCVGWSGAADFVFGGGRINADLFVPQPFRKLVDALD
jgi:hypothetical protein